MNKLELSPLACGLWRLTENNLSNDELVTLINTYLEAGYNTFDHADIYGGGEAQRQFGEVLHEHPELREKMIIVSKCGIVPNPDDTTGLCPSYYNTSYDHIMKQVDIILKDLQIEYLDVLLIHRVDHLMDYKEVAKAFNELKESGKVKHFGVSNFLVPQLRALIKEFPEIEVNQIQVSVDHLEHFKNGVVEACSELGLKVMAYSPLGGGNVFDQHYGNQVLKSELESMSKEKGCTVDQLMLAWILKHPLHIVPILGTMKVSRAKNQLLSTEITLTNREWYRLYAMSQMDPLP